MERPLQRFLVRAFLPSPAVLAAIAAFAATLGRPNNADTLWHLALGRWILTHRMIPDISRFYYSAVSGHGYNYSWLSQAALFGAYRLLGGAGLALLTSVVAGFIFYLLYKLLERDNPNLLVNLSVLAIALVTVTVYLSGRPVMFTMAFFALELLILSGFVRSRSRLIWLIPPLTALWTNLHPGFVLAPLLIIAFLPLARNARDRWALAACLAATGLAVACNPYGWRMYLMPLETARSLALLRGLSEWRSVSGMQTLVWGGFVALVACGLALRRQTAPVVLMAVLAGLAAGLSARNMPLFGLVAVFVLGRTLLPVLMPVFRRSGFIRKFDVEFKPAGGWFWAVAIPLLLAGAVRCRLLPVNLDFDFSGYPETAARFIAENGRPDHVFARETSSGYLLWVMPERRLFYDAKGGFSPEAVRDHNALVRPQADWRDAADRNGISTFLLERDSPLAVVLDEAGDWNLEFSDSLSVLYVRALETPGSGNR